MTLRVLHEREDGSFVVERNGLPYHVTPDDPLFAEAQEAASAETLQPEPPPPPPPVVPPSITRRQLLLALAGAGLISAEEALAAAMTGAVPAAIDAVFAQLPAAEALGARITWATMSVAERDHPLIGALIAAGLATADQVDALFTAAAQL